MDEGFLKVLGNGRKENEDELDRLVEEWTVNYSPEEIMTLLQAAGVGAGVLETGENLLESDPQLRQRHSFREPDHPEIGRYLPPGPLFSYPSISVKCAGPLYWGSKMTMF